MPSSHVHCWDENTGRFDRRARRRGNRVRVEPSPPPNRHRTIADADHVHVLIRDQLPTAKRHSCGRFASQAKRPGPKGGESIRNSLRLVRLQQLIEPVFELDQGWFRGQGRGLLRQLRPRLAFADGALHSESLPAHGSRLPDGDHRDDNRRHGAEIVSADMCRSVAQAKQPIPAVLSQRSPHAARRRPKVKRESSAAA